MSKFNNSRLFLNVLMTMMLTYTVVVAAIDCNPPVRDYLHFTKNLTDLDSVRARQFIRLDCCVSGFSSLRWYFKNIHTNNSWIPFPFLHQQCDHNADCPIPSFSNQTLMILKSVFSTDNGSYMCVAYNSSTGRSISHVEDLLVYECEDRTKPQPIPPHDTEANVGQNVTFQCAADFGCKNSYLRGVEWYIGTTDVRQIDKRYIITTFNRELHPLVQTNLTILNVQQSDFDLEFSCWIISDYDIDTPKYNVKLQQKNIQNKQLILIIVVPCLIFIVVVTAATKAAHTAYGPQMTFYLRSRGLLGGLPKMKKEHLYHAMIVHDNNRQEDDNIAEEITRTLEEEGYKITNLVDSGYGQGVFSHFGENLGQSAAIIILDMDRNSQDSSMLRVFIESSLRSMSDSLAGFTIIQQKGVEDSVMDSLEYQGLKRMEWPGTDCTERQRRKFFKQLQLRLPEPRYRDHLNENTPLI
ncbi:uncharacterized protein LOC125658372 isoform X2 [Ostrea edulis]|nr:uncharacterized protein LOC125658372 isoform X2 [Ostrea edulis]XP_048745569.2 uncharacterized protein LOC125658372 isoform X2 [Ostrea edulis]